MDSIIVFLPKTMQELYVNIQILYLVPQALIFLKKGVDFFIFILLFTFLFSEIIYLL